MLSSFFDDIKNSFRQKENGLTQLIIVNIAIYIAINAIYTILYLTKADESVSGIFIKYLAVPSSLKSLVFKPWTLITYMFLHEDFFHILFNMLWLYWLGKIFYEYLGNKKLISVYFLGGLSGALLYILAFNIFPAFKQNVHYSYALGASASVLAIIVAIATLIPNYSLYLLIIGPVKLKYIAAFSVILDFLSISKGNAGGHIAHLGGAIFGFIFIKQLQKGNDISMGFQKFTDTLKEAFFSKGKLKVSYKNTSEGAQTKSKKVSNINQDILDSILDKISKSGYDSLSKEEKDLLFKASNDNK